MLYHISDSDVLWLLLPCLVSWVVVLVVRPGEGRVHACLREHRKDLSDGCRREEMLLEQQEAEHIELRPNLLKACADERQSFCKSVQPGSGRVFRCASLLCTINCLVRRFCDNVQM